MDKNTILPKNKETTQARTDTTRKTTPSNTVPKNKIKSLLGFQGLNVR